jgi:hypothetical protein
MSRRGISSRYFMRTKALSLPGSRSFLGCSGTVFHPPHGNLSTNPEGACPLSFLGMLVAYRPLTWIATHVNRKENALETRKKPKLTLKEKRRIQREKAGIVAGRLVAR